MHPIASKIRQLGLYLLAWIPVAAIVAYLLIAVSGMTRLEAAVLAPILCLIYAFDCLSVWYPCKATPIETSGFVRLLATHGLGAGIMSAIWVFIARGIAHMLASSPSFRGLPAHVERASSLLFVIGLLLYILAAGLYYKLLAVQQSQALEQRLNEAKLLARDAELRALKTQINPHFLFNSLHSISALTSIDPGRARDMCVALADFLRLTLGMGERTIIPLEEELSLLRKYVAVEKIRFGARLSMQEDVQLDALACTVPPLLLQPLIENAVAHGIANLPQGGWIKLEVHRSGAQDSLDIRVSNNYDCDIPPRRRNGVGLVNVRQRLEARYGDRAHFLVNKTEDCFEVRMNLPAETLVQR